MARENTLGYDLESEHADVEAVVEMVGSLLHRWQERISPAAKTTLWQHNKFDPTPWPALVAADPYDVPIRASASLSLALTELKNAMDFLAHPPTAAPNLTLSRSRDGASREMADLEK